MEELLCCVDVTQLRAQTLLRVLWQTLALAGHQPSPAAPPHTECRSLEEATSFCSCILMKNRTDDHPRTSFQWWERLFCLPIPKQASCLLTSAHSYCLQMLLWISTGLPKPPHARTGAWQLSETPRSTLNASVSAAESHSREVSSPRVNVVPWKGQLCSHSTLCCHWTCSHLFPLLLPLPVPTAAPILPGLQINPSPHSAQHQQAFQQLSLAPARSFIVHIGEN